MTTTLTSKQSERAVRSQVLSLIKKNICIWCCDRKVYNNNINDLQDLLNEITDNKYNINLQIKKGIFADEYYINDYLTAVNTYSKHLLTLQINVLKEWLQVKGLW